MPTLRMQEKVEKPTDVILNRAFIASAEQAIVTFGEESTGSFCYNALWRIGTTPRLFTRPRLKRFAHMGSVARDVRGFWRWRRRRHVPDHVPDPFLAGVRVRLDPDPPETPDGQG